MENLDVNELAKVSRLFESLDDKGRKRLLALAHKRHVAGGEAICREGEPGVEFFVISRGEVSVTAAGGQGEVARLGKGGFFGEMAALNGDTRTATCTAVGDVELIAFPLQAVEQILREYPSAREVLHQVGVLRMEKLITS